jgi:hypothetical protein
MSMADRAREKSESAGKRSVGYLNLPKGLELFQPNKKTKKAHLAIIPFVVNDPKNMDEVEVGEKWYRRGYFTHSNIGIQQEGLACRKTIGKKCPICDQYHALKSNEDADEDDVKALKPKLRYMYLVLDLDDTDKGLQLWDVSNYLFQTTLDDCLKTASEDDPEVWNFAEIKSGRNLKIKFRAKSFNGNEFLETVDVIFEEREEPIPKSILSSVPDMESILVVLTEEKMLAKLNASEDDEDETPKSKKVAKDEDDDTPPKKSGKKDVDDEDEDEDEKPTKKSKKVVEDEDDSDEDDIPKKKPVKKSDDEDDEAPPKKTGKKPVDEDDDEDLPPKKKKVVKDEDDDSDEEEKPSKKTKKVVEDADDEEDDAKPPKKPLKLAKKTDDEDEDLGAKCPHGYRFGTDCDMKKQCATCKVAKACSKANED